MSKGGLVAFGCCAALYHHMLLRRHFYFLRFCPLMCIWYVWGYCENKVPIEGCQSVEWWHTFCICSGRLVSISACEEKEQMSETNETKQSCKGSGEQGAKAASLCWAQPVPSSAFGLLRTVQSRSKCEKVEFIDWIWMSACTKHDSWAGHGGLHMRTQHSGGWSRRSAWAIQSNIGSNIKQMLTPKNCWVSEDHVWLSRGNNKIYTYMAM